MKQAIRIAVLSLPLLGSAAMADERRGGDAALGALSGAVVFGPVGAVAGAIVGYTAGPSIAHSWGFRRSSAARRRTAVVRQQTHVSANESQPAQRSQNGASANAQMRAPSSKAASAAPPVQGLE